MTVNRKQFYEYLCLIDTERSPDFFIKYVGHPRVYTRQSVSLLDSQGHTRTRHGSLYLQHNGIYLQLYHHRVIYNLPNIAPEDKKLLDEEYYWEETGIDLIFRWESLTNTYVSKEQPLEFLKIFSD